MQRVFAGVLCAVMLGCMVLLTGCGGQGLVTFTWQVETMPTSLDPQLATNVCEKTAAAHLFRGLMKLDENGTPVPDCAETVEVSADGLTYTFRLKDDLWFYSYDEEEFAATEVTAEDFVFGLQRVFLPATESPYAAELAGIVGSEAVLAGGDVSQLGVTAPDSKTVQIRLSEPDDTFLSRLCTPGAMPCDKEFFESTRGAYGLGKSTLYTNGDFYLYNWADEGVFLRRKDAPSGAVNNLRLVLADNTETLTGLALLDEKKQSGIEMRGEIPQGYSAQNFEATTWAMIFNTTDSDFSNLSIRQGIAQVLRDALSTELPGSLYSTADGLIPQSMPMPDGSSHAGNAVPDFGDAETLYRQGLSQLGKTKLSNVTVLLPEDEEVAAAFEIANQQLQRQLSAFFSVKQLPEEELEKALASGEYQMVLLPLSSSEGDPAVFLESLLGEGSVTRWQDAGLEQELSHNRTLPAAERTAPLLQMEQQMMNQAAAVPIWFEQTAFVTLQGWQDVIYSPFGPRLDVRSAVWNG